MNRVEKHSHKPDVTFNGGSLDCGSGLLLLIRQHMDPLSEGQLLEIVSTESSVDEDLPAWCRLTNNSLVSWTREGSTRSFLVCKGLLDPNTFGKYSSSTNYSSSHNALLLSSESSTALPLQQTIASNNIVESIRTVSVIIPATLPAPSPAQIIHPLSVMGIGSWPRPSWLTRSLHDRLTGKMPEEEFQRNADDAVRLCVDSQIRSGVDVITDGEQRRDNYSSFVGNRLDNCLLIPLTDLLPLVDDPEKFKQEMDSLDVPADKIRHPAVFGKIGRSRPLALHEFSFLSRLTDKPIKIALPGPYLLTRTMWMECIADKAYASREDLSEDIVRVLREEIHFLLAAGVSIVQLDEPVLTEIVMSGPKTARSFMCGALSERSSIDEELSFASYLINAVTAGLPAERLAIHVCRGNWTPDESVALTGSYEPLLPLFGQLENVGTLFLEFCTPRAGELEVINRLPKTVRIGVGVVNPKNPTVESVNGIAARIEQAISLIGFERVLLNPDCGFATFADNPVSTPEIAEQKLHAIVQAVKLVRERIDQ